VRIIARAPIRICDCGGWTDTWFAGHGRVFNIAVRPCAEVRLETIPAVAGRPLVVLDVADYGDRYAPALVAGRWERHPLLEAAIVHCGLPTATHVEIRVTCAVPAGASTGTSAAVTVALVGALTALRGTPIDGRAVARAAHEVETVELGRQSGIQDQICSALGGINDITMTAYPDAEVRQFRVHAPLRAALERRMAVVLLGASHDSSTIHRRVIERLERQCAGCPDLDVMRRCAAEASAALAAEDLEALGLAMAANTEAQRRLHPDLVSVAADRVIQIARAHGAAGWKVNGAGGDGGSLTILGSADAAARGMMRGVIEAQDVRYRYLPVTLDTEGLTISGTGETADPSR
jgi:D-glycero-alpha-D-manno-heptose-7-phosphate kinase